MQSEILALRHQKDSSPQAILSASDLEELSWITGQLGIAATLTSTEFELLLSRAPYRGGNYVLFK